MAHESDFSKQLTSLLINRQVPEFVREDHPLFISFLEAYYEFLENEQGTQNNDLTTVSKSLRRLGDIDDSIDSFETSFLNTFANLIPKDATLDKAFLIKNVLPLYLSKGNEKSFKLLFRMLFGVEADIVFPEDQVLRASDGQYTSESILTIADQISSFYTGTGNTNQSIMLAQKVSPEDIEVRIDGIKKEHVTDYFLRKEDKKILFNDTITVKKDINGNIRSGGMTGLHGTNRFIDIDTPNMSGFSISTYNFEELRNVGDIITGQTTITFKDNRAPFFNIYTGTISSVTNSTNLLLSSLTTTSVANGNIAQTVTSAGFAGGNIVNVFGNNTGFLTTTGNVGTPASGSDIRVLYKSFNDGLLKNRRFRGVSSNATAVIERVFPRKIDISPKVELFFDPRKSSGTFSQSEEVTSTVIVNGDVVNISTNTFSSIEEIRVVDGGRLYNIGDPVTLIAGGFKRKATAQVASLGTEFLSEPTVNNGGAGFAVGGLLQGGNTETGFVLYTVKPAIDTSGNNTPNSFILMGETFDAQISDNTSQTFAELVIGTGQVAISNSTQVLSTTNVGGYARSFTNTQVSLPDGNSVIKHVVNSSVQAVNIGPIQNVLLVTSNTTTTDLPLDGAGALVEVAARTTADVGSFKGLGRLEIANTGNNYTVGDIIEFASSGAGDGALARVSEANANGSIINTEFEYPHYKNFGTGIRSSVVNIATVSANTGFRGVSGVPNVYVSSVVVDAINVSEPNVNVGLSGVYMTPQANHSGFNFHKGDNPVRIGDIISILGHERKVTNVSSNITIPGTGMFHEGGFLTVDRPFPNELDFIHFSNGSYFGTRGLANSLDPVSISAQSANVFGAPMSIDTHFPKGGAAYDPGHLPTSNSITIFRTNISNEVVSSSNATLNVECLLGDGEIITANTDDEFKGAVETIRLTDFGVGYQAIPDVDLSGLGDGNANATAVLTDSVSTTEGRFISSRGLISEKNRKVQGQNYYQEFVYLTKVPVEFEKYKTILKGLVHPAGYRNRAEFEAREISNANVFVSTSTVSNSISGTVNVTSGSIFITGSNTIFTSVYRESVNLSSANATISRNSRGSVGGENYQKPCNLQTGLSQAYYSGFFSNTATVGSTSVPYQEVVNGFVLGIGSASAQSTTREFNNNDKVSFDGGNTFFLVQSSNTSHIQLQTPLTANVPNNSTIIKSGLLLNPKAGKANNVQIAVNNEVRTVSTIISNTNVEVTLAFTANANAQSVIVLV